MSRSGQSKNGNPAISCPQWLRAVQNHFTIWRCKACCWATGRPNSKSSMSKWPEVKMVSNMTLVDPSLTLWRHLSLIFNDVIWRLYVLCIDFQWRHRIKGASSWVMLLTICDFESPRRAVSYYWAVLLLKKTNMFCTSIYGKIVLNCGHGIAGRPFFDWPSLDATRARWNAPN